MQPSLMTRLFQLIIPQTEDSGFQSILSDIRGRVIEGGSLAGAMGMHPQVFLQCMSAWYVQEKMQEISALS